MSEEPEVRAPQESEVRELGGPALVGEIVTLGVPIVS